MTILPYKRVTIDVPKPPAEVAADLRAFVEPRKWFRFSWNHKPFEGNVFPTGFRIWRIIHYRNSFRPVLHGHFEETSDGTRVHVTMKLHPLVFGFLCYWFGFLALFSLAGGLASIQNAGANSFLLGFGFCAGMGLFGFGLTYFGFWFEVPKSRKLLEQALGGRALSVPARE